MAELMLMFGAFVAFVVFWFWIVGKMFWRN